MACLQNSCYSTHFFLPLSLFCFLLVLFSFYRFRFGSFFPHGYSRCEMRWLKVSFVSDLPSPNLIILILCASREARITKKFSLRVRILLKSRGTEFSVISLCSLAWGTRAVYKKTHAVRFRLAVRFRCPKLTYASAETGSSVALLAEMSTSS